VTSGPGNIPRVYGAEGGEPLFSASVPGGSEILALSPDNKWLAIKGAADSVLLWSLTEGVVKHRLGVPHFFWGTLSFSPDSRSIAIGGGAFAVYVWDTETGAPLTSIHGLYHVPRSLWFTRNSDSIVVSAAIDSSLYAIPFRRSER
jgi:WD40 repeat protein